jgi:hypothetical protein
VKKTPVEGQVKGDSSRGSSKGDSREGQVMKTPVGGLVKEADLSSHQGRCTMTLTP